MTIACPRPRRIDREMDGRIRIEQRLFTYPNNGQVLVLHLDARFGRLPKMQSLDSAYCRTAVPLLVHTILSARATVRVNDKLGRIKQGSRRSSQQVDTSLASRNSSAERPSESR